MWSSPTHCRSGFSRDPRILSVSSKRCVYDADVKGRVAALGGNEEANDIAAEAAPTRGWGDAPGGYSVSATSTNETLKSGSVSSTVMRPSLSRSAGSSETHSSSAVSMLYISSAGFPSIM